VPLGSADGVAWRFSNGNGTITGAPAAVPGCAHADLLALGLIGEPNAGINHLLQRWIASDNFSYYTGAPVPVPPSLLARRNVNLVARGLDTAVTVFVNGEVVLVAANSHRTYIIDVRSQLASSSNATLSFNFTGPVPASLAAQAACASRYGGLCSDAACTCPAPWPGPAPDQLLINAFLRKEQQSFAWDFAPPTGTSGVTVAPFIVAYDSALLRDVIVDTRPAEGGWSASVSVRFTSSRGPAPGASVVSVKASIAGLAGASASANATLAAGETIVRLAISVGADVKLWWPNGYGAQTLYHLSISAVAGNGEAQNLAARVGFRTISVDQSPLPGDESGDGRLYRVVANGVPIYSRGSNWVPSQTLEARVTTESLRQLFGSFVAARFTTLRIWAGGTYASDDLLSLADEAGIIVQHDFMFGDQFDRTDAAFLQDVAAEVRDNVFRTGSHASLGVYFSCNKMASGYSDDHQFFSAAPFYSALYFGCTAGNVSAVVASSGTVAGAIMEPHRAWRPLEGRYVRRPAVFCADARRRPPRRSRGHARAPSILF
jgi:beta-mannosidase